MSNSFYKYETVDGDTFDIIALAFTGDEYFSTEIMKANPDYVRCIIFSAGIELKIPIVEPAAASTLPPWKR